MRLPPHLCQARLYVRKFIGLDSDRPAPNSGQAGKWVGRDCASASRVSVLASLAATLAVSRSYMTKVKSVCRTPLHIANQDQHTRSVEDSWSSRSQQRPPLEFGPSGAVAEVSVFFSALLYGPLYGHGGSWLWSVCALHSTFLLLRPAEAQAIASLARRSHGDQCVQRVTKK